MLFKGNHLKLIYSDRRATVLLGSHSVYSDVDASNKHCFPTSVTTKRQTNTRPALTPACYLSVILTAPLRYVHAPTEATFIRARSLP